LYAACETQRNGTNVDNTAFVRCQVITNKLEVSRPGDAKKRKKTTGGPSKRHRDAAGSSAPGLAELFEIVNRTARHFAEQPLYLLAAVIAESRESGQDTYVKARGCISQASPTLPSHVQAARRGKQKLTDECCRLVITVFKHIE
jgi:hypothetical protein